jgi:predicted nucleic acid-binding protein
MPRYVIRPDVAHRLAQEQVVLAAGHQLVAPTLLRSQLLALLYEAVRRGEVTRQEADRQLAYVRGLQIRLLGDRVSQRAAWTIADQLGWHDTLDAEYVAVAQMQADALITLDAAFAAAVKELVAVAPFEALQKTALDPEA